MRRMAWRWLDREPAVAIPKRSSHSFDASSRCAAAAAGVRVPRVVAGDSMGRSIGMFACIDAANDARRLPFGTGRVE